MAETDPQDPLPEATWTWRRVFTYAVTAALLALLAYVIPRMPAAELKGVAYWLIALVWTSITYYLIAPSAEHIVAVIQAWSTRRAQAGQ